MEKPPEKPIFAPDGIKFIFLSKCNSNSEFEDGLRRTDFGDKFSSTLFFGMSTRLKILGICIFYTKKW